MGRDRVLRIRKLLQHNLSYRHVEAVLDPLWHSWGTTENFLKNCAAVAVPVDASDLDDKLTDLKREQ